MFIAILGRQPALGIAELERCFGSANTSRFSDGVARVDTDEIDIQTLGGSMKAGRVILELERGDWRRINQQVVRHYEQKWASFDGKITLGISSYGESIAPREVQKTGLILKQKLKNHDTSLRLVPNAESALSSATSHNNKLGLSENKVELLIVRGTGGRYVVAESTGAQNITAYARRDQERPKRDAFVGMLPPKLAQIMVNLALRPSADTSDRSLSLLDPFCGTGTVLQEALLSKRCMFEVYGSDLSDKMVDFTQQNITWLQNNFRTSGSANTLIQADATTAHWAESPELDCIVTEAYLGQPFSAPPSPSKLNEVRDNCNRIITEFLQNIGKQIRHGTGFCVAVPAWRDSNGQITHLPLIETLGVIGYKVVGFKNIRPEELLYYREDQIVARELLVLEKA